MNILYISPMVIDKNNLDGVARKILSQWSAFDSYEGVDNVYLASYFEDGKYLVRGENYEEEIAYRKKSSKQLEFFEIYPQLTEICKKLDISGVYFRIFSLSWASNKLFKNLHKQGIKIAVEIPTYPFWKEKWMDVLGKLKTGKVITGTKRTATNMMYFWFAHKLKKYIESIVTFSDITRLWGIPVIGIANGYDFNEIENEEQLKLQNDELNLLMVASVRRNHGADRVIKGLSTYYKNGASKKVIFHIVGDGDGIPELKALVEQLGNIWEYVIFYGFKAGDALEAMYKKADIGISAIAFHRLGVHYASPLKSKEYFAKGIPVVGTTVEHDILKCSSSAYYYAISEDETDVDIDELYDFYEKLSAANWTNRAIANDAENNFAWRNIMKPIYDALSRSYGVNYDTER